MRTRLYVAATFVALAVLLVGCTATSTPSPAPGAAAGLHVLAAESFLADIAQQVAGDRLQVATLIPLGVDPHTYEPSPAEVRAVAGSDLIIVNGAGFESFLAKLLANAGGTKQVVEAAAGLSSRVPGPDELSGEAAHAGESEAGNAGGDPHFWLDPLSVVRYVENIRDALAQADPDGAATYSTNAAAYIEELKALDVWIAAQVAPLPPARRLLVTDHESWGYFADRYGFRIVGAVIPSFSSDASPSAQEMAALVDRIKATGVRAIFLETGSNTALASQLANEAGIEVVTRLLVHSITPPGGVAPHYLAMMRYNTGVIVEALR